MAKLFKAGGREDGLMAVNLAVQYLRSRLALLILALMGAAFGFIALGAFIVQSERSELVPYVVTVDKQGVVLYQGRLEAHPEVPESAVAAALCGFVSDMRRVSSDSAAQRAAVTAVYSHIKDGTPAQHELDDFYRSVNPFERGKQVTVEAVISNVIAQPGGTYQIDWQEREAGELKVSERSMRALISYEVSGPAGLSPENLLLNPLGIFVTDFVVSQVLV